MVRSPYREETGHFGVEFGRLVSVVGPRAFVGQEALIAGCGSSAEEAIMVLDSFPNLSRIHMVDWYPPHIDALERTFSVWGRTDPTRDYRKVMLHLADLAYLDGLETGSIGFVYSRFLFETLVNFNFNPAAQKIMDIQREMCRVSQDRAIWYLLEYSPDEAIKDHLARLQVFKVKNQDDMWIKIPR